LRAAIGGEQIATERVGEVAEESPRAAIAALSPAMRMTADNDAGRAA
jgi:hypothetical protein